jgi:NAD(P)-dependent dehydrogenase (short-subunit alcohol dehydrogenase family)
MRDLRDARVMVTGASLGIGREIAFGFAAAGSRLALTYREHGDECAEVAQRCRELGSPEVLIAELDLADAESARRCVLQVEQRLGDLDILVNNAGVVTWRPFLEQSLEEIERQIEVNLTGTLRLTWLLLPLVRDAVIVVGSTASLHGTRTLGPYCASKWGVRGFVKALAKEHPDKRIVAVHPTVTATRMNDSVLSLMTWSTSA